MTPPTSHYPPLLLKNMLYYFFIVTTNLVIQATIVPTYIPCLACNYDTKFHNQEINSS